MRRSILRGPKCRTMSIERSAGRHNAVEFGNDGCARFGKVSEASHDGHVVGASRGFGVGSLGLPTVAQHGFIESDDHMGLDSVGALRKSAGDYRVNPVVGFVFRFCDFAW